ncbi:MAG: hypothetical protein ISQ14_10850 [Verrucomicrobiae bacterium]|jgi:hypothetical protein|nr:hypothetical protein [Verrucomicrobiae bacterium]
MNILGNRTRLLAVARELATRWQETREQWRDRKAAEFEREFLDEIVQGVNTTVATISDLDKLIGKIRKDCE